MRYRFGLLGEQIRYSLSPDIFRWMFAQAGLSGDYVLYDRNAEQVETLLHVRADWNGLNVTTPHKSLCAAQCDSLSDSARCIGAVNTLYWKDGKLCGDNTDVIGFRYAFEILTATSKSFRKALIIGGGGAARAVLYALSMDAPEMEITIASRDPQQTLQHLQPLANRLLALRCLSLHDASETLVQYDLIIQATPVGSRKIPGTPLSQTARFRPDSLVFDLIYSPAETDFMAAARLQGARTANGLAMLIAQAAASFELWTTKKISMDMALNDLLPQLISR